MKNMAWDTIAKTILAATTPNQKANPKK